MSSRLKDRGPTAAGGGGGGPKIAVVKPLKPLPESTPKLSKSTSAVRRTPIAGGKENPSKVLSSSKPSRPNPLPKLAAVPGVRWSTSSLPRGKPALTVSGSEIRADRRGSKVLVGVENSGRDLGRELDDVGGGRKSIGGVKGSVEKGQQPRGLARSNSSTSRGDGEKMVDGVLGLEAPKKRSGLIGVQMGKKDLNGSESILTKNGSRNAMLTLLESSGSRSIDTAGDNSAVKRIHGDVSNNNGFAGVQTGKKDLSVSQPISMKNSTRNVKAVASECSGMRNTDTVGVVSAAKKIHADDKVQISKVVEKLVAVSESSQNAKYADKTEDFYVLGAVSVDNKNTGVSDDLGVSVHKDFAPDLAPKVGSHTTFNCKKEDMVSASAVPDIPVNSDSRAGKCSYEEVRIASENQNLEIDEPPIPTFTVFVKETEPAKGAKANTKYKNKLQEKLSLLEEKVQKIFSEIKLTKEMLDCNNPNESKLILSDIQSKISGIEKAVGQVVGGSKDKVCSSESKTADCMQSKSTVAGQSEEAISSKHTFKALNHEELEARFFPHHKLIRNQNSSCTSGAPDPKQKGIPDAEEELLSPRDDDAIALEFLASLNSEEPEPAKISIALKSSASNIYNVGGDDNSSAAEGISRKAIAHSKDDIELVANENLEEFDDQENKPAMSMYEELEESSKKQITEIGRRPSTAGWFVSEGEAVLLAHDDGSCTYYDVANYEIKSEYKPPSGLPSNIWGDCWLIRASGVDGCSGKYVVAASAGNSLESGFCSWDFYTKEVAAFCVEDESANSFSASSSRAVLGPLSNSGVRRTASTTLPTAEQPQWWCRPSGPLLLCTGSRQKYVSAYDIRDGELVMKWEVNCPVIAMEYSSPLQWRSRGKVIIAGRDAMSLWDVNSLNPQPLVSVSSSGKKIQSLHINNTDAELGGGVRQRVSQSEVEGNDGVFCTQESINVLDFRLPSGVGLKISSHGVSGLSIFSRGDSVFIGNTEGKLSIKGGSRSRIQHYSIRKGKLVTSYELPEFDAHFNHSSITQVWGNTNYVMGICGMGLSVFDATQDGTQAFCFDRANTVGVKEVIGPDDLYCPTFDYLGSRVLVISRDCTAFWRYLF